MRFRIDAKLRCLLLVLGAALLGGCVSVPYNVKAMRFDLEPPRQRAFQVGSPQISVETGAVNPTALSAYVQNALLHRGFRAAPEGSTAGMLIDVEFEQQAPRVETRTGTEKVLGWQPEQTVLARKQTKTSTGLVITETVPRRVAAHAEPVGTRTVNYLVKLYPKRLRIVGRAQPDPNSGEVGRPLWSVEVRDDHEVHDLESCAVQMIAAAMDYLGDDFSGERTIYLSPGDERTRSVRKGGRPRADQASAPADIVGNRS